MPCYYGVRKGLEPRLLLQPESEAAPPERDAQARAGGRIATVRGQSAQGLLCF